MTNLREHMRHFISILTISAIVSVLPLTPALAEEQELSCIEKLDQCIDRATKAGRMCMEVFTKRCNEAAAAYCFHLHPNSPAKALECALQRAAECIEKNRDLCSRIVSGSLDICRNDYLNCIWVPESPNVAALEESQNIS